MADLISQPAVHDDAIREFLIRLIVLMPGNFELMVGQVDSDVDDLSPTFER